MERRIDMSEVSDGRYYTKNDLAKLGCADCAGCSACCQGMGTSIVLDPLDVFRLMKQCGMSFDDLLEQRIELNMVDALILPNLKMHSERDACSFLTKEGRCSIHSDRPGFCRMFPLGRIYETRNGKREFHYFLQVDECKKKNRTKVKIQKWIGEQDSTRYEKYILDWHFFLKDIQKEMQEMTQDQMRQIALNLLTVFYRKPYDENRDFYEQFYERLRAVTG